MGFESLIIIIEPLIECNFAFSDSMRIVISGEEVLSNFLNIISTLSSKILPEVYGNDFSLVL